MNARKPKAGRPRSKNPATELVLFRVPPTVAAKYRAAANRAQLGSLSAWLRAAADAALAKKA